MREWTDRQGRSFRGELYEVDEARVKVRRESDFRVFELQLEQLSDADQKWIADQQKPKESAEPTAAPTVPAPTPTAPSTPTDRTKIPTYNQSDFYFDGTCGPSAIMNFLMWWGVTAYPEVLPRGNAKTQAKRTMQRLIRTCDGNNGTNPNDMEMGLVEYFERYSDNYSVDIEWRPMPSMEWLAQAATGDNLVVLQLSYYDDTDGGKRRGGHYVSLVSSEGNQAIVHTWGKIYELELRPLDIQFSARDLFISYPDSLRKEKELMQSALHGPYLQAYRKSLPGEDPSRTGLWNGHVGIIYNAMLAKIRPATPEEIAHRTEKYR
ncbi:hypothetical protein [Cerasicoccus maritimus]|uniref:hypothetical protein n=1 Tax=Cerasicoccus maritimus TaxID=490089 RepID=UPI002852BC49|nr:hypothetical protein [Cerasicoccus maritimus]